METRTDKKLFRYPEGGFDHRLSDEELRYILDNYDYDPDYDDDDEFDEDDDFLPEPLFDKFGNPTRGTLDAMYEAEHGIGEIVTAEEAIAEIHALCSEGQEIPAGY